MNSEIQLLAQALSTSGEAEANGVKYIYMDDSTIYRFENNRMKKVSAAMIKKANKLLESQGALPNDLKKTKAKKAPAKKSSKVKEVIPVEEEESEIEGNEGEELSEDDEPAPPPPPKTKKKASVAAPKPKKTTSKKTDVLNGSIDLNEYYNNKNRMEFMSIEIDRLTNKVNKLKQYKNIVNKITGGEYEAQDYEPLPQQAPPQQVQGRGGRKINDSLFDFN